METQRRTIVKTLIYRCWVLYSTYMLLVLTGQSLDSALIPTIVINCVWMTSYYCYERLWTRIQWGKVNDRDDL